MGGDFDKHDYQLNEPGSSSEGRIHTLREAGERGKWSDQSEEEEEEHSEEGLAELMRQEQEILQKIAASLQPGQLYLLENFTAAHLAAIA